MVIIIIFHDINIWINNPLPCRVWVCITFARNYFHKLFSKQHSWYNWCLEKIFTNPYLNQYKCTAIDGYCPSQTFLDLLAFRKVDVPFLKFCLPINVMMPRAIFFIKSQSNPKFHPISLFLWSCIQMYLHLAYCNQNN